MMFREWVERDYHTPQTARPWRSEVCNADLYPQKIPKCTQNQKRILNRSQYTLMLYRMRVLAQE